MFYFKEFFWRCLYYFITCLFCFIYFFFKKEIFLFLLNNSVHVFSSLEKKTNFYTYTSPVELLETYLNIFLQITFVIHIPYFLWLITDFYKSSFNLTFFNKIKYLYKFCFFVFFFLFVSLFFCILPGFWSIFDQINFWFENSSSIKFLNQLQFIKYFIFLKKVVFISLICYFIIFSLILICFLFNFSFLLEFRKIIILLNILVATFLSPPDIFSQIILFLIFSILFEILSVFFLILIKYTKKNLNRKTVK